MIVHFLDPNLSGHKRLYSFNPNWSRCRTFLGFKSSPARLLGTQDPSKVTCEECLGCMRCDHKWEYLYTGIHGSDKGDDYLVCRNCGWRLRESTVWTPDTNDEIMERIFERLKDEDSQLDLIHSGFKAYQWNV